MLFARASLASLLVAGSALAQTAPATQPPRPPLPGSITSHPGWPQPRVTDVDTVDHILAALYASISAPAHQPRDWNRMRTLFLPDARLLPITIVPGTPNRLTNPATDISPLTIDAYIDRATPQMEAQGFAERSVHDEVARFGNMAQVFSTYESRHDPADPAPFARGVNSIQLLKDGGRFWIVNILWDAERAGSAIPAQYLPSPSSIGIPPTSASPAGAPGEDLLTKNFAGEWVGQLEYRDFQTDERTFLPTWLTMNSSADGRAVALAYLYDDGPTKTVRESSLLTFFPQAQSAALASGGHSESFAISGLEEFRKLKRGTLTLTGTGTENGKAVAVRITLTLRRNLFTLRKETRPVDAKVDFQFRDAYTFTRANPPATQAAP